MPYNQINILSTRPLSLHMIEQASERNLNIDTEEFIQTASLTDPDLKTIITTLADQSIISVFTSMNAVEAVATNLQQHQPLWKVFALGTATKKIAAEKFNKASIYGGGENASALADRIIAAGDIKSVVFFCGDQRRDELPAKLKEHKIQVREIVVYHTKHLPHRISKTYDAIMFFSPSAVESFFIDNVLPPATILFAIGETTAGTIKQYASNKVITSDRPGKEALLDKLISYFNTINQH